jgi:hypothetical protein
VMAVAGDPVAGGVQPCPAGRKHHRCVGCGRRDCG